MLYNVTSCTHEIKSFVQLIFQIPRTVDLYQQANNSHSVPIESHCRQVKICYNVKPADVSIETLNVQY